MKKLLLILPFIVGCTDAQISKLHPYGARHKVELYSGGEMVRSWISTGKPVNEEQSDGFYFCDSATNKVVRVTGDIVITAE